MRIVHTCCGRWRESSLCPFRLPTCIASSWTVVPCHQNDSLVLQARINRNKPCGSPHYYIAFTRITLIAAVHMSRSGAQHLLLQFRPWMIAPEIPTPQQPRVAAESVAHLVLRR